MGFQLLEISRSRRTPVGADELTYTPPLRLGSTFWVDFGSFLGPSKASKPLKAPTVPSDATHTAPERRHGTPPSPPEPTKVSINSAGLSWSQLVYGPERRRPCFFNVGKICWLRSDIATIRDSVEIFNNTKYMYMKKPHVRYQCHLQADKGID